MLPSRFCAGSRGRQVHDRRQAEHRTHWAVPPEPARSRCQSACPILEKLGPEASLRQSSRSSPRPASCHPCREVPTAGTRRSSPITIPFQRDGTVLSTGRPPTASPGIALPGYHGHRRVIIFLLSENLAYSTVCRKYIDSAFSLRHCADGLPEQKVAVLQGVRPVRRRERHRWPTDCPQSYPHAARRSRGMATSHVRQLRSGAGAAAGAGAPTRPGPGVAGRRPHPRSSARSSSAIARPCGGVSSIAPLRRPAANTALRCENRRNPSSPW